MNLSICLDQYASNFDVNNLSTNGFNVYTNLDLTNPLVQGIPYQNLFSPPLGNCPYLLTNIPAGVTQIYVADNCISNPEDPSSTIPTFEELVITCCYAIIDVPQTPPTTSSFCTTCSLDFDVFSSSYVGQIVAGNLTSTCGPVTDYTIGWYKDGDYSSPEFISGKGTAFLPYQQLHPLTGSSAVPVLAGDWEGIIHDIAINGVTYSSVSGSANGQPIPFESCFDTVVVNPLTCANGPYSATSKYSHKFNFNSQAVGTTPAPVSLTYNLNSTTKYFAYYFEAYAVWDEIEIKWKSGNPAATPNPTLYSQPIYLEKIKCGYSGLPNSTLPTTTIPQISSVWPKIFNSNDALRRVLTLTSLPTSSNPSFPDLLEIVITPNPTNNNTQWKAGFQCLNNFDCTDCSFNLYPNNLPKISKIELNKVYGCDAQQIQISVSGCYSPNSDFMVSGEAFTSLTGSLLNGTFPAFSPPYNNTIQVFAPGNYNPNAYIALSTQTSCTTAGQSGGTCGASSTGSITLNKTLGQIQLTFNTLDDYLHYKNSLISNFNNLSNYATSSIPCGTDVRYYRRFNLSIPIQSSPTANCGDNTIIKNYKFKVNDYFNVQYTENPASNFWSITIPQTPMTNCYPVASCDNCNSVIQNTIVTSYNQEIADPITFTFTTTVGAKYSDPFNGGFFLNKITSISPSGSYCADMVGRYQNYSIYSATTMPFISSSQSPTGWSNLTSLSSSLPCNTAPYHPSNMYGSGLANEAYLFLYQVRFLHLTNSFNYTAGNSTNDFEIYSLSNYGYGTGSFSLTQGVYPYPCPEPSGSKIYSYIDGVPTVYTSSYFIGGNPTLIIDP